MLTRRVSSQRTRTLVERSLKVEGGTLKKAASLAWGVTKQLTGGPSRPMETEPHNLELEFETHETISGLSDNPTIISKTTRDYRRQSPRTKGSDNTQVRTVVSTLNDGTQSYELVDNRSKINATVSITREEDSLTVRKQSHVSKKGAKTNVETLKTHTLKNALWLQDIHIIEHLLARKLDLPATVALVNEDDLSLVTFNVTFNPKLRDIPQLHSTRLSSCQVQTITLSIPGTPARLAIELCYNPSTKKIISIQGPLRGFSSHGIITEKELLIN